MLATLSCSNERKKNASGKKSFEDVEWVTINSVKGKFKIDFPSYPTTTRDEEKTIQIIDGVDIISYSIDLNTEKYDHPNLAYSISYADQMQDTTEQEIQSILDGDRDGLVSTLNGYIEYESKIKHKGYPGRYIYLTVDDSPIKISYRVFCIKKRVYKLLVLTPHGELQNKLIRRFLDSFEYLEEEDN